MRWRLTSFEADHAVTGVADSALLRAEKSAPSVAACSDGVSAARGRKSTTLIISRWADVSAAALGRAGRPGRGALIIGGFQLMIPDRAWFGLDEPVGNHGQNRSGLTCTGV